MGSFGTVPLDDVWAMLNHCLPGYTTWATDHHWRVTLGARTFATLPLGPHGPRRNVAIQTRKVRELARFFGILDCAKGRLEQLA